jgi:malate dehydrogenase (oxaloacetate-decarboxylating)
MKLACVYALADAVETPTAERVLPDPLDRSIAPRVAAAVAKAARESALCAV